MTNYKTKFDAFICGGSQHVAQLKPLLGKLQPHATVHLASCFLSDGDLHQLRGFYDVLHRPRHSANGYSNFELFSIRDINRLARAPYFMKLDADVHLEPDWMSYVEEGLVAHSDAVLFGPRRGNVDINFEISGAPVRRLLNQDVVVTNACKVIGGFYVGLTSFFKTNRRFMDLIHEFLWCYRDGVRYLPSPNSEWWPADARVSREPITVVGQSKNFQGNEDTLRSLVVHALGAGDRLHVFDSHGRVQIQRANTMNPYFMTGRNSETPVCCNDEP